MDSERVTERAFSELKKLHGSPIDKEMGGLVAIKKARTLCKILDLSHNGIRGEREGVVGMQPCVDLSNVLEECESFDNE